MYPLFAFANKRGIHFSIVVALIFIISNLALTEQARAGKTGDLMVEQAWAKPSPPGVRTGAAYVSITNMGSDPDKLISASTDIAETVELHEHVMEDGLSKMRELPFIELAAGKKADIAPGRTHIMLIDIKAPLKEGESFPMTFNFEKAPSITLDVEIGMKAMSEGHEGMDHGSDHTKHN